MSQAMQYDTKKLKEELSKLSDGDLIYVPANIVRQNDHFGRIQKSRAMSEHDGYVEIPVYLSWTFSNAYEKEGFGGLELCDTSAITISPDEKIYLGPDALRKIQKLPIDNDTMAKTLSKRMLL